MWLSALPEELFVSKFANMFILTSWNIETYYPTYVYKLLLLNTRSVSIFVLVWAFETDKPTNTRHTFTSAIQAFIH